MLPSDRVDVLYRKGPTWKDTWLYSFYDCAVAEREEAAWFCEQRGRAYDRLEANAAACRFGTSLFESDIAMEPALVWDVIAKCQDVEEILSWCLGSNLFDDLRGEDSDLKRGNGFIHMLSSTICLELVRLFDEAGLLDEASFDEVLSSLVVSATVRVQGKDWMPAGVTRHVREALRACGLDGKGRVHTP